MKACFVLTGAALLLTACGSIKLEPVEEGTGGAGGSGGDAHQPDPSGSGAAPNNGGGPGSGGANQCSTPNPAGCISTGCPSGEVCSFARYACVPSQCVCDPESDAWACTLDCGGGICVPDPPAAPYGVRIGYWPVGGGLVDFCVAYENAATPWEPIGILEKNGLTAAQIAGTNDLTPYLPLAGKPVGFGLRSGVTTCAQPAVTIPVQATSSHLTLLSAPQFGEIDKLWYLNDALVADLTGDVRVVNATASNFTLEGVNQGAEGLSFPPAPFANSPSYAKVDRTSLETTMFTDDGLELYQANWAQIAHLPTEATTIIITGTRDNYVAIGCSDLQTTFSKSGCFKVNAPAVLTTW